MQLLNKFNKIICFYFFVVDIYSNYAFVIPLKKKQVLQLVMLFTDNGT